MTTDAPILTFENVSKDYGQGDRKVHALRNVDLVVRPGEFVSITGPSGSGKSTLLNLAAALDVPTQGTVWVNGQFVHEMPTAKLAKFRRQTVAFIFQSSNLIQTLNAEHNVAIPLRANGMPRGEIAERTRRALEAVSMAHRAHHYPEELSAGELQRVGIARALATDARIILADEPTGNLDTQLGEEILELLKLATENEGRSVVLVTHDLRAAAYGHRLITLRDGRIVDEVVESMPAERS